MISKDQLLSSLSGHAAEEQEEIAKHADVYRCNDPEKLKMSPRDWEKLRNAEPLDVYLASMVRLGDIHGLRILDAGCGDGWMSVILAKLGAMVAALDLSPDAIEMAKARVAINDVTDNVRLHAGSFYSMPFPDHSFDIVIGQAVLHHLKDKRAAAMEVRRVMKPGGRAIFVECFGNCEFLERLRLQIPVACASPEDLDHWKDKISYKDIAVFRDYFEVRIQEFHLLSRLDRVIRSRRVVRALNLFDRAVLNTLPFMRRYARTVLIELA
jgi:SAM-dependent methyltransferase